MGNTLSPRLPTGTRLSRKLSSGLWRGMSTDIGDPDSGFFWFRDFHTLLSDEYTFTDTTPTSGTATFDIGTPNALEGNIGVVQLDSGQANESEGGQVQWHDLAVTPNAGVTIGIEARLKISDNAVGAEFFFGLSEIDTTIIASSANSSANHIGFECLSDDGVLLVHTEDGGTRVSSTTPKTLVDNTYLTLGLRVQDDDTCEIYVDNVEKTGLFASTPDICVGTNIFPSIVCYSEGTTDPVLHLDWLAVGAKGFDITP